MKRRTFLAAAAAVSLTGTSEAQTATVPENIRKLKPMTDGVKPITDAERGERIEKARRLMKDNGLAAVLMESGSSMFYFTGKTQQGSGWLLPASGDPVWLAGASEISAAIKDRKAATGKIGLEEQVRFGTFDALRDSLPGATFASATPVTAGCRMIKSPAEIALMKRANEVTLEAIRAAVANLREGMTQGEVNQMIGAAHQAMGYRGGGMVSFGSYTAFPHGSIQPQKLREGDFVLMDITCKVEGYESDVTRTVVYGKPTARQRQIWALEKKAQDAALSAAKVGAPCEAVDIAARKVLTDAGFGPGYKTPGLPHRTGHGIGLDVHEWTNLVRGNQTPLQPGMCFSDEPTIVIYGEFGVRLEDCFHMTADGPVTFTKQSPSLDQPFA